MAVGFKKLSLYLTLPRGLEFFFLQADEYHIITLQEGSFVNV